MSFHSYTRSESIPCGPRTTTERKKPLKNAMITRDTQSIRKPCSRILHLYTSTDMVSIRTLRLHDLPSDMFDWKPGLHGSEYYCQPSRMAHSQVHNIYQSFLAQHMPHLLQYPDMAPRCWSQENLELQTAFGKEAPLEASAPRNVSVWLLIRSYPMPRRCPLDEHYVRHLVNGFVHLMACDAKHPAFATTIRSTICCGMDAERVAKEYQIEDVFQSFDHSTAFRSCLMTVWLDNQGDRRTLVEPLYMWKYRLLSPPEDCSQVEFAASKNGMCLRKYDDMATTLQSILEQQSIIVEANNPELSDTMRRLKLPISDQPLHALRVHVQRLSFEFQRIVRPRTAINREGVYIHEDALETRQFTCSGHAFQMVPMKRLNELIQLNRIPFQHDGGLELSQLANANLLDESVPAFGIYLQDANGCPPTCKNAAHKYFSCNDNTGWHLRVEESPPMDEQCAALHLFGAMSTSVSLAKRVTAYAACAFGESPPSSSLNVVFPFVIPINSSNLREWCVIPTTRDAFMPTNPLYDQLYDKLMTQIISVGNEFCKAPMTCKTQEEDSFDACHYAQRHIKAIDASYEHLSLRSNTEVSTVGSASFYLSKRRKTDSAATSRLMDILCSRYGCSTTIEEALQRLCDEQDLIIKHGLTHNDFKDMKIFASCPEEFP